MRNRFSFQRFWSIVKKEFFQIIRDPVSIKVPIVIPIVWIVLFGYSVQNNVDHIALAVFDQSKTQESRELVSLFSNSGSFTVAKDVASISELSDLLDAGKVRSGIVIPPNFQKALQSGEAAKVKFLVDGTDPTIAGTALNSASLVWKDYIADITGQRMNLLGIGESSGFNSLVLATDIKYNPTMENSVFSIPGLIALIVQNITIMLSAFTLVREREKGTIEQLMVTPVKASELIFGKLIPYIVIGYIGFLFSLIICILLFGVHISGSFPLFLGLGFLFVLCTLSIGILISTIAKTQVQAMNYTSLILLPSVLLSGFIFPREAMPVVIDTLSYLIPLTYFIEITRGIMVKGVGIEFLITQVTVLCIFTLAMLSIACMRFKKTLD
ncbi:MULTISPECIES: ABC transporter permease [unclassified Paenibacillus]|uniref:ABC transporter permease n=1 Tax=unclassified Paenibacillus TaxID=185978 RepID=UPI0036B9E5CA